MTSIKTSHRVGAYVDGYNLYYGRLRGSPYKWLDLLRLVEGILARRDQNEVLAKLNLFTAYALARFATHGAASVEAQTNYLRALAAAHGERFEAVFGIHNCDPAGSLMPEFVTGQPYDRERRVRVWRIEEKKTDVNYIAIGIVMPIRSVGEGLSAHRRPSASLGQRADWVLPHISAAWLESAQLPPVIPTRKKPIRKPSHW